MKLFSCSAAVAVAISAVAAGVDDSVVNLKFDRAEKRVEQKTECAFPLAGNVFTVAFWVKPLDCRKNPCGSRWERSGSRLVVSAGSGYYNGFRAGLRGSSAYVPYFEVGKPTGGSATFAASDRLAADRWAHVAWTWDGTNVVSYVNGDRSSSTPCSLGWTPLKSSEKLVVGPTGYGQPPLPMHLAELRVWPRALSAAEIDSLASADASLPRPARVRKLMEERRWAEARTMTTLIDKWDPSEGAKCTAIEPKRPPAPIPGTSSQIYVAPDGDDSADGSRTRPFASWKRAAAEVRELKCGGAKGGATVWFRGGEYRVAETVKLGKDDSGDASFPIVYAACPGEKPIFTGMRELVDWKPVTDVDVLARLPSDAARANVQECDAGAAGIAFAKRAPELGPYARGGEHPVDALYVDGECQLPARFPNGGFLHATNVVDKTNCVFRATPELADFAEWAREPALMACGYFVWCWADFTVAVKADAAQGSFRIVPKLPHPIAASWNPEMNYFLCNSVRAIDREGEWHLDRASGKVYAWLPSAPPWWKFWAKRRVEMPAFDAPFLEMDGVSHVQIRGLSFTGGRNRFMVAKDCSDVLFAANRVENFGGEGLKISNARDFVLWGNVISGFGRAAMDVSGGDRKTLTASGIRIENNEIAHCSRAQRTYAPGLRLWGCGTKVVYNHFHDILSSAMRLEGNDFLVSMNVVEDVVKESGDQGGVDIYNNPSYQGNVYSYNVWRNIGCGGHGQAGIRFDDRICGQVVYGNRFDNCSDAKHFGVVQMNGGRRNLVDNNVIVNSAIGFSCGGWTDKRRWIDSFTNAAGRAQIERAVNIYAPPYTTRYPGIETLVHDYEMRNTFTRNLFVGDGLTFKAYPPQDDRRNWTLSKMPDLDEFARETEFDPLPPESEIGTYEAE